MADERRRRRPRHPHCAPFETLGDACVQARTNAYRSRRPEHERALVRLAEGLDQSRALLPSAREATARERAWCEAEAHAGVMVCSRARRVCSRVGASTLARSAERARRPCVRVVVHAGRPHLLDVGSLDRSIPASTHARTSLVLDRVVAHARARVETAAGCTRRVPEARGGERDAMRPARLSSRRVRRAAPGRRRTPEVSLVK